MNIFMWLLARAHESVDTAIDTGMDPSPEAREPAFTGPAGICACAGALAGGFLGVAATVAIWLHLGVPRPSMVSAILGFGSMAALLGAALGGILRAFAEALWILPPIAPYVVGISFGLAAGWLAALKPGVPRLDALIAGMVVGGLLVYLFRVFESRLP